MLQCRRRLDISTGAGKVGESLTTMHATLSTKCQLILPVALRRRYGLKARSRVEFEARPDGVLVRPTADPALSEYIPPMENIRRTKEEIRLGNTFGHTFGDPE